MVQPQKRPYSSITGVFPSALLGTVVAVQVTIVKLINSISLLHKTLRSMSRWSLRINPLHLITALCFVEVIIDLLHAHPEQALLHWISIFRLFVVIFVKAAIQVCNSSQTFPSGIGFRVA